MAVLAKNATREVSEAMVGGSDDGNCTLEGLGAAVATGVGCEVEIRTVGWIGVVIDGIKLSVFGNGG